MREANRNPRRWVGASGRVQVIEGWHPSAPSRLGYNLKVDGEWLGTFASLDDAADAAAAHVRFSGLRIASGRVALTVVPETSGGAEPEA